MEGFEGSPAEMCVGDKNYEGGKNNSFFINNEYTTLRGTVTCGLDRSFLAVNVRESRMETLFKKLPLGINRFSQVVNNRCADEEIK